MSFDNEGEVLSNCFNFLDIEMIILKTGVMKHRFGKKNMTSASCIKKPACSSSDTRLRNLLKYSFKYASYYFLAT